MKFNTIRVLDLKDEVFQDYKKPSMLISTIYCDWKCWNKKKHKKNICQNSQIINNKIIEINIEEITNRYLRNGITQAIIFAGLEPFKQFDEILTFIKLFREISNDDIIIYTGYYLEEVRENVNILKQFSNIIIKFGRYICDSEKIYDDILGIYLSSKNQYAIKIS